MLLREGATCGADPAPELSAAHTEILRETVADEDVARTNPRAGTPRSRAAPSDARPRGRPDSPGHRLEACTPCDAASRDALRLLASR
ncbi:hypothetical protein SAMN05421854_104489 [Amycolatopsis rubida]|uniref:Uncharacterized protein n=1 Tax=Amycolatopsis rubida TaxID=112413 RepID=A0A1I5NQZ2_9PSEU|nr:hypothetical protein SAMN05421854_104489 [Amycolatopsis rubida]